MTLAAGDLIHNRYQILRRIGQGGMGAVYEAIDQRLGASVALKQTLVGGNAQLDRAFEREARLLASLRHSALPKVMDYFSYDDGQFLVMEYIAGRDLAQIMEARGEPFETPQVLGWADQLLAVLEYLHSQRPSVIHRDIKPQNIKLTPQGEIILLDFGLAKSISATQANTTGSIFAFTPQYAPPEQAQGIRTDTRSDLYSVGATLYALLAGDGPAASLVRAAAAVGNQPDPLQPLQQVNPAVSSRLGNLIQQIMALDPAQRPASAAAVRTALQNVRPQRPVPSESATQTAVRPQPVAPPLAAQPQPVVPPLVVPPTLSTPLRRPALPLVLTAAIALAIGLALGGAALWAISRSAAPTPTAAIAEAQLPTTEPTPVPTIAPTLTLIVPTLTPAEIVAIAAPTDTSPASTAVPIQPTAAPTDVTAVEENTVNPPVNNIDQGMWIVAIDRGSEAEAAGLKVGQLLLSLDGTAIRAVGDAQAAVRRNQGRPIEAVIFENGVEQRIVVTPRDLEIGVNLCLPQNCPNGVLP